MLAINTDMRVVQGPVFAQAALCSGARLPFTHHSLTPSEVYLATYFHKTVLPKEC